MTERQDAVVVGGGPAGLATAVLLAQRGLRTTIVRKAGPVPGADVRTTALLAGSVAVLEHLGVWEAVAPQTAALRTMRLVDDTKRLIRAPTVSFQAAELGLDAFGHNIPNHVLNAALEDLAARTDGLTLLDGLAPGASVDADAVKVTTDAGTIITAALAVAADGRNSKLREAAGIDTVRWRYDQTAVTLNLEHAAPHRNISTEFHTPSGPFTLVPLPGQRSSLVAVCRPADAEFLMSLPDGALAHEVERRAHSILGKMTVASARGAWPLEGLTPRLFGKGRVVLVGEAAHVIPPIGAQGLNLGFRDAASLADLVEDARATGEDVGGPGVVEAYDRARRTDVWSRTVAVDALNRTLLSPLLPAQALRGVGLFLADRIGPLRRALLREGVQPLSAPRLMRRAG